MAARGGGSFAGERKEEDNDLRAIVESMVVRPQETEEEGTEWTGPVTREALLELGEERDRIEHEMDVLLDALGSIGLKEPLVDREGFPRDDVDIVAVRGARHRYACLQTDYTRIMHKLEDGLGRLHQQARDSGEVDEAQLASGNRGESNAAQEAAAVAAPLVDAPQTPLAIVDGIDPDGAAARSGLHRGDEILAFGQETASLAEVGRIVHDGAGTVIPLRVRRRGEEMDVALEIPSPPRLGVHLAPWKP